jgi:hypothetical protein
VAGVLFSYATFGIDGASFGADASARVFLIAVLGGLGSIAGPVIGTAFVAVIGTVMGTLGVQVAVGTLVVVILLVSPGGLGALVFQIRDSALRRIADREGILVPSLIADGAEAAVDGRAPIRPRQSGGRPVVVARRYKLDGSWVVPRSATSQEEERVGG